MGKLQRKDDFEKPTFLSILNLSTKFIVSEVINSLILLIKKNRRYEFNRDRFKGLNIGSSLMCPENWLGLSGGILIMFKKVPKIIFRLAYCFSSKRKKYPFKDYYKEYTQSSIIHHNLLYGIPFPDNSVPYIFSSHFFEHLSKEAGAYLIKECYRVLIPGGYFRIIVPSLDREIEKMLRAIETHQQGNSNPVVDLLTTKDKGFVDSFSRHRYMYNYESLSLLLNNSGFEKTNECEKGKGFFPDMDILDLREGLIIEARKPLGGKGI